MKSILWFKEVGMKNVAEVGGKNASLGEMINNLAKKGVAVPNGFATTSNAYFNFLKETGLREEIRFALDDFDYHDLKALAQKGKKVRQMILGAKFSESFKKEIIQAYRALSEEYGARDIDVAVRSSATAEDLPGASFAGQQETFLNVSGAENVLEAVKKCFASLFTDRAIAYRQEMGFSHLKVGLSAGVQKMVRSDKGASGVMFSCDTESGFGDVVLINAGFGLGENVVLGRVDPDQYYVFETTLRQSLGQGRDFRPIIQKKLGSKEWKLIYGRTGTKNIKTTAAERKSFVLNDQEVLQLAKWSMVIEEHYSRPMDMEWAKDGIEEKLYIVQARPETVQSRRNVNVLEEFKLQVSSSKLRVLAHGMSVGSKIGAGKAHIIKSAARISEFKEGEVLVTGMTDPDWVPAMKLASAIVTDAGGRTCHAAIVARELGIPCIVGTEDGTKSIKGGKEVTVDCSGGEEGKVYEGKIPFEVKKTDISGIQSQSASRRTKILMNVGDPGQAFSLSFIPNDGVGLAREEFIIANTIKIHPNALIDYHKLPKAVKKQVDELSAGYEDKVQFYVDKLAEGIGRIGAAFYPKPVIVRFSDFKTNEYRQLIGGELYEPAEENPMIGWRGASRYYHPKFKDAFVLECKAMKKAREVFGLDNVQPMIPFCRTVEEGKKVLDIMKQAGLAQGQHGLKVYAMCEIPANVILAENFLEIFDGFSIGSNDLTQLALGLDRDNAQIAGIGNEQNEAVKELIKNVVKSCKEKGKYSGICGQAPSDFPDFAKFLVEQGIESISLNPDSVIKTILIVSKQEKNV